MNLYLNGGIPNGLNNHINLFLNASSSGQSGVYHGLPLMLNAVSGNIPTNHIPLFLQAVTRDSGNNDLNLYVCGEAYHLNNALNLYMANRGVSNSLNLYVQGSGVNSGYYPSGKSMNLFIQRNFSNAIPLYLRAAGVPMSGQIPLYVYGDTPKTNSLNLSLPDVVGALNNLLKLYTRGY